ncbi:uncharacterized protein LOC114359556 [Ostrinia furnacalis]|uniref:uncharacterized protein LOC114359556 n=1 Tax=Ostrinia furnacalis TaxID=93504 RepID=UPI0010388CD3|nr:uncharacterized protein LOC114359556 [Ostrinia furnacalis]
MASIATFALILCVLFVNTQSSDLNVGTSLNSELLYLEAVQLSSIPLKTRTKNVFYNNSTSTKIIKGITAIDLARSEAKATITAGGVGSTFANIRLKSVRGSGLNYQIQIFG